MGRPRKYTLTIPKDNIITEDLAYWVGFIVADGCIWKEHGWRFDMNLKMEDREHLQKFLNYLHSDHPIYTRANKCTACVRINSNELVEFLQKFGIHPAKSYTTYADDRLANNRHFWRGVFDGDGHVGFRNGYPRIKLVGSQTICEQFQQFCAPILDSYSVKDHTTYAVLEGYGIKAEKVISTLYNNANIVLERKAMLAGRV
jgi:hypothetical protein